MLPSRNVAFSLQRFRLRLTVSLMIGALWTQTPCHGAELPPACEGAATASRLTMITAENLERRKVLFESLCRERSDRLIDAAQPGFQGRIRLPARAEQMQETIGPAAAVDGKGMGSTILVFVVEASGRLSWLAVLQSSGSARLDERALKYRAATRYRTPAKLDGAPVAIFVTEAMVTGGRQSLKQAH